MGLEFAVELEFLGEKSHGLLCRIAKRACGLVGAHKRSDIAQLAINFFSL